MVEEATHFPQRQKKGPPTRTCTCRLVGNGVDLPIGAVTLPLGMDAKSFAKKAYGLAKSSMKKLELPGYKIVVTDETGAETPISLEELRSVSKRRAAA